MKRLLLVGYFGFDNLGDELLLISLLEFIKRNLPNIKPLVLYGKDIPSVYGAEVIPRKRLISGILNSDGICFSGGSILQDVTSVRSLVYYLGIILLSLLMSKPVIMVSQGFGPVNTWLGKRLIKILNSVYSISVRDQESLRFLNNFNITRPKIYQGNDLVFFLDKNSFKNRDIPKERDIIISIRESPGFREEEFLKAFTNFKERNNLNISFFVTHKEEDTKITERFARKLNCEILFWDDPFSAIEILSSTKFIVSMRLHPLIISALLETPFLGITYDPKVNSLLSLFPNSYSIDPSSNSSQIEALLDSAWKDKEKIISDIIEYKDKLNRDLTFGPIYDLYSIWCKDR